MEYLKEHGIKNYKLICGNFDNISILVPKKGNHKKSVFFVFEKLLGYNVVESKTQYLILA